MQYSIGSFSIQPYNMRVKNKLLEVLRDVAYRLKAKLSYQDKMVNKMALPKIIQKLFCTNFLQSVVKRCIDKSSKFFILNGWMLLMICKNIN